MCIATRIMLHEIIPSLLGALMYVLFAYYALLWFVPYFLDRILARRISGFISTLVFPVTAVVVEYLNNVTFGSWGATAYSQAGNLPLLQIMSITGMWGVTFLVLWLGPLLNWVLENGDDRGTIFRGLFVYCGLLAAVLLYGGLRVAIHPQMAGNVRVASFTPDTEVKQYLDSLTKSGYSSSAEMAAQSRESLRRLLGDLHAKLFDRTRLEARAGAAIVLWPEGITKVLQEDESSFLADASTIARSEQAYLLIAYLVLRLEQPDKLAENVCVLIDSAGAVRWRYIKTHPVPGSSDMPGTGVVPSVDSPYGRLTSVVCYDMDFTNLVQQAGRARADIMLVPAADWKAIDPLHAIMASFRAIENGFSMVRQTDEGMSLAVDYLGRVIATLDYFTTKDQHMTAQVPMRGTQTVYAVLGDWFAWTSIALLLILVNLAIRGKPLG